jgi:hypothetical protein
MEVAAMSVKRKLIIITVVLLCLLIFFACILSAIFINNKPEPVGSLPTNRYSFEVNNTQLIAISEGQRDVIFKADRIGAKLAAAISPYRIYLLCDDVLYSINADGSDQFKIASKCYNPGELSFSVTDSNTTELRTLWYFEGYVYFITYGTTSKLCRFEVGGSGISEICKNKVSAFTISEDGVLYGYSDTDNMGKRELTFEKDLTK